MNKTIDEAKYNFFAICYDCLYYGYTKAFIFNNYINIIEYIGKEEAGRIYEQAFNKICNE